MNVNGAVIYNARGKFDQVVEQVEMTIRAYGVSSQRCLCVHPGCRLSVAGKEGMYGRKVVVRWPKLSSLDGLVTLEVGMEVGAVGISVISASVDIINVMSAGVVFGLVPSVDRSFCAKRWHTLTILHLLSTLPGNAIL